MSKGRSQNGESEGGPATPTSGGEPRSRWRELLMALVAFGLFFALLEAVLALSGVEPVTLREDPFVGFAGDAPLFVPETPADGEPDLVTAPARLELFNEQRFPRRKPEGAYRIFCLGGSTTFGRPYDDATSFAGWLRELLPEIDPGRRWEVINAGGTLTGDECDVETVYFGTSAGNAGCDEKTFRKWAWFYTKALADLDTQLVSFL